jgi:hypothetical protein
MPTNLTELATTLPIHTIFTLGFYIAATIYIIFTAIFYYHWKEYSTDAAITKITFIVYLATTVPLIITIGIMSLFI